MNYATLEDVEMLFRPLLESERARAEALLTTVSSSLRFEARKVDKNLDDMVLQDDDLREVAKSVTVDVVGRALMTPTNQAPMTQFSESALGYSVSGSFLVPGGGLFIKDSELKKLGLKKQKIGMINLWE